MSSDLATRRDAVLAEAKRLRSVRPKDGGTFHDECTGSPQHADRGPNIEPAIDEHVVAFKSRYETCFAGACVPRVQKAIAEFTSSNSAKLNEPYLNHEDRKQIETAKEYSGASLKDGCLYVRNAQFNDVLAVLQAEGLGVTLTA